MDVNLVHQSLETRLLGIEVGFTAQFRGIPYGRVSRRFAAPESTKSLPDPLNCQEYGPRCPQDNVDVRHLLRIPADITVRKEEEDEFACLNLDVICPRQAARKDLPVFLWIHGGSQVVTFASASSGICDPAKIVEDAQLLKQPIIFVSINYRLNIFAFGDGMGPSNLALKDQSLAIDWVQRHIAGFGGDPDRMTIAGESAGAVYCHAHIVMGAPVKQAILMSGSLYLSPPQPEERGTAMLQALAQIVKDATNQDLTHASVEALLAGLQQLNINSMWLQLSTELQDWSKRTGNMKRLMIGDVEYESVIWANGVRSMRAEKVVEAFSSAYPLANDLKRLYSISIDRPAACHLGALDLLNDVLFALPVDRIQNQLRSIGATVHRYVVDQVNPWQRSHRAHHAVDLLYLFGGTDLSGDSGAIEVGRDMRAKWISFVNEKDPWACSETYAFGPHGRFGVIDEKELVSRRRKRHLDFLMTYEPAELARVVKNLAAGRISLLN